MERNKTLSVRGKKKNTAAGGANFAQENPMHHKTRKKKTQKSGPKVDAFARTESVTSAAEALTETFISEQSLSKHMTAESTSKKEALPVIQSFETQPQKTLKKAAANNILVVAHPSAQAQQVFELLKASGVQEALPSRREQLSPQALTATLLKAHGLQWQDGQSPAQIEFLQVSSMWQSLVLDLALGNMEQPLWAWMEPQAIHLLDFWAQQNEQTVFMLVYDDIHNIYQQCLQGGADASPEAINAKVQTWVAYNEALLQFHLRNPERSFLVHAKQVTHSAQSYLQQLNQRIASPVQLQPSLTSYAADSVDVTEVESNPADMHQIASGEKHTDGTASASVDALTNWLMDQLVQMQTDALELYEQLQATANLPLARMHSYQKLAPYSAAEPLGLYQAWASLVATHTQHKQSLMQVQMLEQIASSLQNELKLSQQKNSDAQAKHKQLEEENHLVLEQLQRLQEELERYYQEKEKLQQELEISQHQEKQLLDAQSKIKKMQDALQNAELKLKHLENVQVELKKTKEAMQAAQKQKNSVPKELEEDNELLLRQLHQVQDELERYYLKNNKQKIKAQSMHPQIYFGAADRIKQDLPYRLGATVIAKSRSVGGWLRMPFALHAEVKKFRNDQKKMNSQELPPIFNYSDADEAERVKLHLSYRIGFKMIENSKTLSGCIMMPWVLLREIKDYRKRKMEI